MASGTLSSSSLDRYTCIALAGVAAEYVTFGQAEGGLNDVQQLDGLLKALQVLASPGRSQLLCRLAQMAVRCSKALALNAAATPSAQQKLCKMQGGCTPARAAESIGDERVCVVVQFTQKKADSEIRWAILAVVTLLRRHSKTHKQLAKAMAAGKSVSECLAIIESNFAKENTREPQLA